MAKNTLSGNGTGLRVAEEETDCVGVLPTTPNWREREPNSYGDFGGEVVTVPRAPITSDRQRRKGSKVDENASGAWNEDLTAANLQEDLQGFFLADLRNNAEFSAITNVDGTAEEFDAASGLGVFDVGNLIFVSGFVSSTNNGLKRVTSSSATAVGVAENLVDDASPAAGHKIVRVGHRAGAGDIDVDVSGSLPKITSTTLDFTTLDLIPGQWVFLGGDAVITKFTNAANNGFKRIRSITATEIVFDKSDSTMVVEASTTETIEIFFGRVLKNEKGALIKKRSYQLERQLGSDTNGVMSEYIVGALPNEATLNLQTADKVNIDLSYAALRSEIRDGTTGVKTGTRPDAIGGDAYNASSDVSRQNVHVVTAGNEAPTKLFAFFRDLTITINNNFTIDKAIGSDGGIDGTEGLFQVGGQFTAYFADTAGVAAVKANSDVSLDLHFVTKNKGITFDLPLITLGDGRLNIEPNQAITLPVSTEAASGADVDATALDHTLLMQFWDYLPTAAD